MSAKLYWSIVLYTGNSIYRALNQARRENWGAMMLFRNYLRLYFVAMGALGAREVALWRGIAAGLFDSYAAGLVQAWWSMSSCAVAKSATKSFMSQLGGTATPMILDCMNAVDVRSLSIYPHEAESFLFPGTKLQPQEGRKGRPHPRPRDGLSQRRGSAPLPLS